jgi:phosphatidylinositol-4,5-bisphosphate 3-kinase
VPPNGKFVLVSFLDAKGSSAAGLIELSLKMFASQGSYGINFSNPALFSLKAAGFNEYLIGAQPLMNYSFVRRELREQRKEILLVLGYMPNLDPMPSNPYLADYVAKFNDDAPAPQSFAEVKAADPKQDPLERDSICMSTVRCPVRVRVVGLDNVKKLPKYDEHVGSIWVECYLFMGFDVVEESKFTTEERAHCLSPRWREWHSTSTYTYADLPRAVRVGFQVWGKTDEKDSKPVRLGFVVQNLVNELGVLLTGQHSFGLWGIEDHEGGHGKKEKEDPYFIFKQTTRANIRTKRACIITVDFDEFPDKVVAPYIYADDGCGEDDVSTRPSLEHASGADKKLYDFVVKFDPLSTMEKPYKDVVWKYRHTLMARFPHLLSKFFQSTDFLKPACVQEAHRILREWSFPQPLKALEFMDCKYHDFKLRQWAVSELDKLSDYHLNKYILQLVQCLKYESYHDSPLSRMLVKRAIKSPYQIGHFLFWLLKAELHVPEFHERFSLILEEYLTFSGYHAASLRYQDEACLRLCKISEMIIEKTRANVEPSACKEIYKGELHRLNRFFAKISGGLMMPTDPRVKVTALIKEKCRYMSSKMVPLWLVFSNVDEAAGYTSLMFKNGDDLRQDMLTIQLLRLMDEMWLADNLDMRLKPYDVMATGVNENGAGVGMIVPVTNADTISNIQLDFGGKVAGALKEDPLDLFINKHNNTSAQDLRLAKVCISALGFIALHLIRSVLLLLLLLSSS